jgi:hypothetical protein
VRPIREALAEAFQDSGRLITPAIRRPKWDRYRFPDGDYCLICAGLGFRGSKRAGSHVMIGCSEAFPLRPASVYF